MFEVQVVLREFQASTQIPNSDEGHNGVHCFKKVFKLGQQGETMGNNFKQGFIIHLKNRGN